ncbi:transglycosylase SLT domain-containing protein [Nitrogeniibacter mangrovi]|nr:transglycosylase SLT domain-containing protein [Nitrogeniibacter mangrovi]
MAQQAAYLAGRGVAFEHGEGVERDPARAAACYCESARLGNAEGMYGLGWMYANGRGVARNDAYAGTLFAMAAMLGHTQAARMQRYTGEYVGTVPACLDAPAWEQYDGLIDRLVARMAPARRKIVRLVVNMAPDYGIEPRFALAIAAVESAFNPDAVSPKQAMGVMQLIPETAARFRVGDTFDARQNIAGGLAYLRWLLAYFEGDVRLVAAAYNAGEGAVERYGGVPPFPETRAYVDRVVGYYRGDTHPYDSRVVDASPLMTKLRLTSE